MPNEYLGVTFSLVILVQRTQKITVVLKNYITLREECRTMAVKPCWQGLIRGKIAYRVQLGQEFRKS